MLCEVLTVGCSAVVRAVRAAGGAGGGVSWRVLACRGGASRQSRVLGARGASRRGGDGPPFSVTWTFFKPPVGKTAPFLARVLMLVMKLRWIWGF